MDSECCQSHMPVTGLRSRVVICSGIGFQRDDPKQNHRAETQPMTQATTAPAKTRAQIPERTLRKDPWWRQPAINATALAVVVIYLTWASLVNADYFWEPYISPLYSPCLATTCTPGAGYDWIPWLTWLSPAIIIIGGPLGFRLTCYYYPKAYYPAFLRAPTPCAGREPHARHTGEARFPLILQQRHRDYFLIAVGCNGILSID